VGVLIQLSHGAVWSGAVYLRPASDCHHHSTNYGYILLILFFNKSSK